MVGMMLKKVQAVGFNVVFSSLNPMVSILCKEGGLYLSYSSILVADENRAQWYEVPFKDISSIDLEEGEEEMKLNFRFENGSLEVKGKDRETILALRHFLLPLIAGNAQR